MNADKAGGERIWSANTAVAISLNDCWLAPPNGQCCKRFAKLHFVLISIAKKQVPDADALISLYGLSFEIDERLEERIQELKRTSKQPAESFPALAAFINTPWNQQGFLEWVQGHGKSEFSVTSTGRQLKGVLPSSLDSITKRLVGALSPIAKEFPFPHFKGIS